MSNFTTALLAPPRIAVEDWLHRVDALALRSSTAHDVDHRACLDELLRLLTCAPRQAALTGTQVPHGPKLDAMIAAAAWDSAALAFVGSDAGFLISRGGGGHHLASLAMPGRGDEVTAGGGSAALAVIAALCLALFDTNADTLVEARASMV